MSRPLPDETFLISRAEFSALIEGAISDSLLSDETANAIRVAALDIDLCTVGAFNDQYDIGCPATQAGVRDCNGVLMFGITFDDRVGDLALSHGVSSSSFNFVEVV